MTGMRLINKLFKLFIRDFASENKSLYRFIITNRNSLTKRKMKIKNIVTRPVICLSIIQALKIVQNEQLISGIAGRNSKYASDNENGVLYHLRMQLRFRLSRENNTGLSWFFSLLIILGYFHRKMKKKKEKENKTKTTTSRFLPIRCGQLLCILYIHV